MKRFLTIAVFMCLSIALTFSFVGVKNADADAILFPFIVKSGSVSTLVTVVQRGLHNPLMAPLLHYQYHYKNAADGQTAACTPHSFNAPTSVNDIVTFDAAGNINGGQAVFNDDNYGGQDFSLPLHGTPMRSFLLVDNDTLPFTTTNVLLFPLPGNIDGTLYGEAMVLELTGGAAWGYVAYNPRGGVNPLGVVPLTNFGDGTDQLGEVIADFEVSQTMIFPPSLITERFFMTPMPTFNWLAGNGVALNPGIGVPPIAASDMRTDDMNARVQLCLQPNQDVGIGVLPGTINNSRVCREGGIFDNNEIPHDFIVRKNIVCTSADDLSSLMDPSTYDTFNNLHEQGWAYVDVSSGTLPNAFSIVTRAESNMMIGRLDYTTAGFAISGTTVPGTLNNFVMLQDSSSILALAGGGVPAPNAMERFNNWSVSGPAIFAGGLAGVAAPAMPVLPVIGTCDISANGPFAGCPSGAGSRGINQFGNYANER